MPGASDPLQSWSMRRQRHLLLLTASLLAGCDPMAGPADGGWDAGYDAGPATSFVTLSDLVRQMGSLDHLARAPIPAYRTLQASSWDRRSTDPSNPSDVDGWFANRDLASFEGEVEVDGRRELVMAEAEGAGAITRIWSARPLGTVRIYIDDFETPAIEGSMEELLGETHPSFGAPFGYVVARGANLYFPIPFSSRMRVTTDTGDGDPGLYYHVNYRLYEHRVAVEPWSAAAMSAASEDIARTRSALTDPASIVTGDRQVLTLPATISAPEGGGVIRRLELRAPGASAEALRGAVLVMRFDGQETVRTPVGDFFGTGPGANELATLALEVSADGTLVSRFPMPFASSAEIAIEGTLDVELEVITDAWAFDADSRHFHAGWRSTGVVESQPKRDLDVVHLRGAGTYVGMHLIVVNPIDEWWGEGDEKIYVDGDTSPTWFGTGTEDYFGYAYTDLSLFSAPYHAQSRTGGTSQVGHVSNLRVHVIDAIPFTSALDFDLELWAWVSSEIAFHWVVYWYATDANGDLEPLTSGQAQVYDPVSFRR